jgi:hypothetical protein
MNQATPQRSRINVAFGWINCHKSTRNATTGLRSATATALRDILSYLAEEPT